MGNLERNLGPLLHFTATNPTGAKNDTYCTKHDAFCTINDELLLKMMNSVGHYKLELINPHHRIIAQKMVEIAKEQKDFRIQNIANEGGAILDTSQHGDWENFRNETLNGQKYDFDTDAAAAGMVTEGVLEFDYVSTDVYHRLLNLPPMETEVFDLFMLDMYGIRRTVVNCKARMEYAMQRLGKETPSRRGDRSAKSGGGRTPKAGGGGTPKATDSAPPPIEAEAEVEAEAEPEPEPEPEPDEAAAEAEGEAGEEPPPPPAEDPVQDLAVLGAPEKMDFFSLADEDIDGEENYDKGREEGTASLAAVTIQAFVRGRVVRCLAAAKLAAAGLLKARTAGHTELAKASQRARTIMGGGSGVAEIESTIAGVVASSRGKKLYHKPRHCWWIVSQHQGVIVSSAAQRNHVIAKRQLLMLRRATIMFYFSCEQLERILEAMPEENHVEVLVTLFSRITDIENLDCARLLKHDTFDKDGNGCVMWEELQMLKSDDSPDVHTKRYLQLCERIGQANLFNPIYPEREYALNLRCDFNTGDNLGVHDERRVAECIIILSAEPGDNTLNETYNGLPFEVENRWGDEVPRVGVFCTTYRTRKNGGSLALRLPLARALLMPGRGRWKDKNGEKPALFDADEDPNEFDAQVQDWEKHWTLDADGQFLKKEEVELRKRAAAAAADGAVAEIMAISKEAQQNGGKKNKKKQCNAKAASDGDMVAMSLQFMRKVKRPKAKRAATVASGGKVDAKAGAEIAAAEAAHKEAIQKKLSAAGVRWKNLSSLVRGGSGGGMAGAALRMARQAAAREEAKAAAQ